MHPDLREPSPSDVRRRGWVAKIPVLHMSNRSIERTLQRSYDDLGGPADRGSGSSGACGCSGGGAMVHDFVWPGLTFDVSYGASR